MRIYSIARQYLLRHLFALGAFILIVPNTTQAQDEALTVFSPRQITHERLGRDSVSGAPIEKTTVSEQVAYRDLDLSKSSDVDRLDERLKEAAESVCSELDRLSFSYSGEVHRNCVRNALRSAGKEVDAAVASANRGYGNADKP
ncbi:MAG TPA: UrcA family protein [Rhizomicrobium sp.]|nr:UrcA family protein [Rhizomicrobium sp.]